MNDERTSGSIRADAVPTRFELVDKDGHVLERKFSSALAACLFANQFWPDQEQDEDRAGNGWDVQLVGS